MTFYTTSGNSQDCNSYFLLQNNKTVEMTVFNNKGNKTGNMVYKTGYRKVSGSLISNVINSELLDAGGKSINKTTSNVKCENGIIQMDMKMFIPSNFQTNSAEATAKDIYLEYPYTLQIGDQLKDGEFNMDYEAIGGLKGNIEISITNRKVTGKETVSTSAGSWECFKITASNRITSKIAGVGTPINMEVTEWFAPGIGLIKTESRTGKSEITSLK